VTPSDRPVLQRRLITRRTVVRGLAATALTGASTAALGVGTAAIGHRVTTYKLSPPRWPAGATLRMALIADLHACEPWMDQTRIAGIVEHTNRLNCDMILLLGDYVAGKGINRFSKRIMPDEVWANELGRLRAPLGVHAILGNHDWWEDTEALEARKGPTSAGRALTNAGIPVYENDVRRLTVRGQPFWLAGLGDQWAFDYGRRRRLPNGSRWRRGIDDLDGTMARITDSAPVVLMAHEPDIFPDVPDRVAVTLSGHTHGGQVQFAGYAPIVPSIYGRRYRYGHIEENNRHLIVSGGLGCSGLPVRFGAPPEVVVVELGGPKALS
jgi:uncharacterized protein